MDCAIYVVNHKKYPFDQDSLYRILCVGGHNEPGALSEQNGENIAQYNDRINECTGLYWIWKNTDEPLVGLCHYRRWFFNRRFDGDKSRLDTDRIREILTDNDAILTFRARLNTSVYGNLTPAVGEKLTEKAYTEFLNAIREKQPDYEQAFRDVMTGNRMHVNNLFVTKREILNQYCEWLFSFLLDATDRIDVAGYTGKPRRVAGYFAEIMPNVWLAKQDLKIYELPNQWAW